MVDLRSHKQVYARYMTQLGTAMNKFHEESDANGKGTLMWEWRHRLVANASRRVQDYSNAHPGLATKSLL